MFTQEQFDKLTEYFNKEEKVLSEMADKEEIEFYKGYTMGQVKMIQKVRDQICEVLGMPYELLF